MRKLLIILLLACSLIGRAQDEYYRDIDWKFYPDSVVQLTDTTYIFKAEPYDYNDPAAILRTVGNYVVDFIGHVYLITDSTETTLTVLDEFNTGLAPQTGQVARCYRSVNNGEAMYIGSFDYSTLDFSSRWKRNGADNQLLWRHGIEYDSPFKRVIYDLEYEETGDEGVGTRFWNPDDNTTNLVLPNGVILQDGHELFFDVINQTGAPVMDMYAAAYTGTLGASGKINVGYMLASPDGFPQQFLGVITEPISNGEQGKVTWFGKVRGNTSGSLFGEVWNSGDTLYVSTTTPGYLTNIQPNAPYPAILVAIVNYAHPTNGVITVRPTLPSKIVDAYDVNGTPLTTTGQFMVWDEALSVFDFNYKVSNDAYSSDWNDKDTVVPTFDNIYDKLSLFESLNYCCDSIELNYGTISRGSQDSLCAVDGNLLGIAEVAPNPPFQVDFVFQNVERLQYFSFYGRYQGGVTHNVHVLAYNYITASWDFIGEFGQSDIFRWYTWPIFLPNNHINVGEVKIRVEHQGNGITAHRMYFDYVEVNFGGTGGGNFIEASAVDFMPYLNITSTNVQGAIQQFYDLWDATDHVPVTVTDGSTIDLTLTGQNITAEVTSIPASQVLDFDTEVSNNPTVVEHGDSITVLSARSLQNESDIANHGLQEVTDIDPTTTRAITTGGLTSNGNVLVKQASGLVAVQLVGGSTGDAILDFFHGAVADWRIGADYSNNGAFTMAQSSGFGTRPWFVLSKSGDLDVEGTVTHAQGTLGTHSALLSDITGANQAADFTSLAINGTDIFTTIAALPISTFTNDVPYLITEVDGDPTNELDSFYDANSLTWISNGDTLPEIGSGWNNGVQILTGTNDTLDVNYGLSAIDTMTGNDTIFIDNLVAGMTGNITVICEAANDTLYIVGGTVKISPFIEPVSGGIPVSNILNAIDVYSWWYDGTRIIINGTKNYE